MFEVEDNNGLTSEETITITVTGTNDAPVAQAGTNTATEDGAAVTGQLTETDADTNDTHTYALISDASEGSATVNSDGSYSFDPGSDFQDLETGETRDVTFVYEVTDNNSAQSQATVTITVTGTNDAPVVTLPAGSIVTTYDEGDGAVTFVPGAIDVSDVDDANIESAIIRFTGGFESAEDSLAFSSQNGIVGVWNPGSQTLSLNGQATLAQYEAALASITYSNSSVDPIEGTRTLELTVFDGEARVRPTLSKSMSSR